MGIKELTGRRKMVTVPVFVRIRRSNDDHENPGDPPDIAVAGSVRRFQVGVDRQGSARREVVQLVRIAIEATKRYANRFPRSRNRGLAVALAILLAASPGWSWGHDGHRLVAKIAARNLSPDTRKKIAAILGSSDAGVDAAMADAATWPDEINKRTTGTGDWHFVDASVSGVFSVAGLCPLHNCIIDRIQEMSDRLRTNQTGFTLAVAPSPPRPMASQELAFLIHFVGDIHQPLHAANDGDRGGNCENLTQALVHADHTRTTELHAVWDVDEVLTVLKALGAEDSAAGALFQRFKSGGTPVQQGMVTDWARESNDLARKDIYQALRIPNRTAPVGQCAANVAKVSVDQRYLDGNLLDTEQQLLRAGIRLSGILNQICAGTGCASSARGR